MAGIEGDAPVAAGLSENGEKDFKSADGLPAFAEGDAGKPQQRKRSVSF